MATETSAPAVNGTHTPHQAFGAAEHQNNYTYGTNNNGTTQPPPSSNTPAAAGTASQAPLGKDEVGWYFVEQYYTTLSRNPDRLYLFYNKKSQFVSGQEADKVGVYGGQNAINNRIKELDFKDCKVRVTNVDAQASESNIIIQVIGEMSNKSQPHKKFVQTFVLATQTNGYFVLNDIFRYLVDEEDELEPEAQTAASQPLDDAQQVPATESTSQEPVPPVVDSESKTLTSSNDPVAVEDDAQQVDKELEEKVLNEAEVDVPAVNGTTESEPEVQQADDAPGVATAAPDAAPSAAPEPDTLTSEAPELPQEPAPSPSPPKQATPQPATASKPATAKTWASMAASANRVATPVTPSTATSATSQARPTPPSTTKTSTSPAPASASAPVAPAPAPATAPTAPAAQREETSADAGQGDEWTAVSSSHARQQSRQTNYQQPEGPQTRAYIRNVHEGIGADELKGHLEQFGELVYFDLSRQKNSAFVEFKTPEGYSAATAANPHSLGGERLFVEERRPFVPRNQFQNNRGRGNMNQGQSRGGFQGRGGYAPRGRGGNTAAAPRGRGGSAQAA